MVATRKTEKLDLRLSTEDKEKLMAAAELDHRSLSDFVLRGALDRADEMFLDRYHFKLNAEQWAGVMELLDAPPRELPRLKKLFSEPSVFEIGEID